MLIDEDLVAVWIDEHDARGTRGRLVGLGCQFNSSAQERSLDVADVVDCLVKALGPDYVVLGGGNARKLKELPPGCRIGENANAFLGGFRLWEDKVPVRDTHLRAERT